MPAATSLSPSQWRECLDDSAASRPAFVETYGGEGSHRNARLALLRAALDAHGNAFGDEAVHVLRAPGRINLRGMHVDTHGGFINTMTLGRETILIAAPTEEPFVCIENTAAGTTAAAFDLDGAAQPDEGWGRYARGCAQALRERLPGQIARGMRGVVASDIPIGAGLSSSASLCSTIILGLLRANEATMPASSFIEAVQAAEWIAGARCGLGDPGAIVLGDRGTLSRSTYDGRCGEPVHFDSVAWPEDYAAIVIDSGTSRDIGGADRVRYSANRAAYSCALPVLRNALHKYGWLPGDIERLRSLRDLKQSQIEILAGGNSVYTVLMEVPERLSLTELQQLVGEDTFEAAFAAHLGDVDRRDWPESCALRGPLIYGMAESARAEDFFAYVACGMTPRGLALMTVGHDGDRVSGHSAERINDDVSDDALARHAYYERPLRDIPGAYGASTPCLDTIVDTALEAGALGASLTGAGLGGCVVAVCDAAAAEGFVAQLRSDLALSVPEAKVFINIAPAGAGELIL